MAKKAVVSITMSGNMSSAKYTYVVPLSTLNQNLTKLIGKAEKDFRQNYAICDFQKCHLREIVVTQATEL